MKILFINKYDSAGGAGIAAYRLQQALHRYHRTENLILAAKKRSDDPRVVATRTNDWSDIAERGINFLFNLAGLQYLFLPISSPAILKTARAFKPDVISLHNIHGGYFETSLLPRLSALAPLVWTLHDMWAITRNGAHTFGNENWKYMKPAAGERWFFPQIGLDTGSWLMKRKQEMYARSRITVVTPSRWLGQMVHQSPLLRGHSIVQIPNGVDLDVFKPSRKAARQALGLAEDAPVVLFAAEHLRKTDYKGGDELASTLRIIASCFGKDLHVLTIGEGHIRGIGAIPRLHVHPQGYVKSEEQLARCYAAADLLLYPTRADNLPTSLIEASACGVPGVAFDVGGCAEIIAHNKSGFIVRKGEPELLAEAALKILQTPRLRAQFSGAARRIATTRFSLKSVAKAYFELFRKVTR